METERGSHSPGKYCVSDVRRRASSELLGSGLCAAELKALGISPTGQLRNDHPIYTCS